METLKTKKSRGQFFTTTNPFDLDIFRTWWALIPQHKKETVVEPFAGANNIVNMMKDIGITPNWNCYDIEPDKNNVAPEFEIIERDTLKHFPQGHYVAITNPPYLAKNSATRAGIEFPNTEYDDLYKVALHIMLENLEYVAAIIPESFISACIFQDRIFAFISLTCKMFEDTACPVCLALFIPRPQKTDLKLSQNDFHIFRQNKKIGNIQTLSTKKPVAKNQTNWHFNDPNGAIGIRCIDGTIGPSIEFFEGEKIDKSKIKVSSRSLTRVSGLPDNVELDSFLTMCNNVLNKYRKETADIFLTSFKGLRKDGMYRRRLDFANAKMIMNYVIENMGGDNC